MRTTTKVHFILFFINLIYSLNYVLVKELVPDIIHPAGLLVLRAGSGFLFFTTLVAFTVKEKVKPLHLFTIFGCAVFGVLATGLFFLKGISLTVPINASLIMILVPILVMVISFLLFKEKISVKKMIGFLIGITGATILITKLKPIDFGINTFKGDVFIFLNAASFATYLVLSRQLMKIYNPVTMARWVFTFGFLMVIPFGINYLPEINLQEITITQWLVLGYVLIFPTCLAFYLYNVALKEVSPTVASSYIFLQPVLTAIIALALGKDHLDKFKIIGGVLIFIGVYTVTFAKSKASSLNTKK